MKIHDTLSGAENMIPHAGSIGIYLCGITVYDESHIGHARTVIIFDVLARYLEHAGATVNMVQNFTDIDDKIINRAKTENSTAAEISSRYIRRYFEDFDRLNVRRAAHYPRATEHVGEIIAFIEGLVKAGVAYAAQNGVYFSVSKFPGYGKLSKKDTKELLAGARVRTDSSKADPLDFAVWKFSDAEPAWDSPWGRGRPGWHIECSAMSAKYLGGNFEIHGGGRDLIFPHHENEIAQSESCSAVPLAKTWMHVGMVTMNGEKMSKSVGNIKTIKHVLDTWGPNITRLFCLSGHYSKPIDYTDDLLGENLARWRQAEICFYELYHSARHVGDSTGSSNDGSAGKAGKHARIMAEECAGKFDMALESDFNTHLALSAFFLLVKETNRLAVSEELKAHSSMFIKKEFDRMTGILGLCVQKVTDEQKSEIEGLISERQRLRTEKKFEEADIIRGRLNKLNVEIIDHKNNSIWVKKEPIKAE